MGKQNSTVIFHVNLPEDGETPTPSTDKWSSWSSDSMQMTVTTPRLFVSSDYGSGEQQEDLRKEFSDGNPNNRHVVMYADFPGYDEFAVSEFQTAYEQHATEYVTDTLHPVAKGKGKRNKAQLNLSPLFPDNSNGGHSVKLKATKDVLDMRHESIPEEHRGETMLDLPRDSVFRFIWRITGVWHNHAQYGFTCKLLRAKWVKTNSSAPKTLKPQDNEFADEDMDCSDIEDVPCSLEPRRIRFFHRGP